MRWKYDPHRPYEWHVWFAWHPVQLPDGEWVWLEKVMRTMVVARDDYWAYKDL